MIDDANNDHQSLQCFIHEVLASEFPLLFFKSSLNREFHAERTQYHVRKKYDIPVTKRQDNN